MALTIDAILRSVAGDLEASRVRYSRALEIQRRPGDQEGAGLSLRGLAGLAAGSSNLADALEL